MLNRMVTPVWPRITGSSGPAPASTWRPLRIGAGGYLTALDIAPDGTKVCRADTYGAFRWDSQWVQLVTALSMPPEDVHVDFDQGCFEIRIAPSSTSRLYMLYQGYLYRSDNNGAAWTKTSFARVTDAEPNGALKFGGPYIVVDPQNADVVYVGTPSNGLRKSTDGGAAWATVSGLATSGPRGFVIAFDPSSAVVGGKTQGIFVSCDDTGLYYSADEGANWTLTTGGPTTHRRIVAHPDGRLFYIQDATGTVIFIYSGGLAGTWETRTISGDGNPIADVCIDPSDPDRVVVLNEGGKQYVSTDALTTDSEYEVQRIYNSADIPWLGPAQQVQPTAGSPFMSVGSGAFDPSQTNTLFVSAGIGVWRCNPDDANGTTTYTSQSAGIEQLVADMGISPPGGRPLVVSWDRPLFRIEHPDVFPSTYLPDFSVAILKGSAVDYAVGNPNFVTAVIDWFGYQKTGYSLDGGATWNVFASTPYLIADSKFSGCIAAASDTNLVWLPAQNGLPYYTTNCGASWTVCSFPGVPTSIETGWIFAYYLNRHVITADRVTANKFYAYNYGPTAAPEVAGIWVSTDSGANFTQVYFGSLTADDGFNAKLRAVPGNAGHLFFTGGQSGVPGDANPRSDTYFMRSTDAGVTWSQVPGMLEVYDFGFGKAKPGGGGYPAIYLAGFYNNDYGIYQSVDNCTTWRKLTTWPLDSIDAVKCVFGDAEAYGRCYVGFIGSGFAYGDTDDAAVPPIITNLTIEDTPDGGVISFRTDRTATSELDFGTTTSYGTTISGGATTVHSLTITGQTSSTFLHFRIRVTDSLGSTTQTNDRMFMTTDITDPSQVTGLTATAIASSKITLADWSATDDVGVDHYRIYASGVFVTTAAGPPFTVTKLLANTLYSFTVSAVDAAGNEGAQSSAATATTQNGVVFTPTAAPDIVNHGFASGSYTFTGAAIGAADAARIVVVGVGNDNATNNLGIASVTIGGIAATKAVAGGTGDRSSLWYATVPTGTTADIALVAVASSFGLIGISVGILSNAPVATPSDTDVHAYDFEGDPQEIPTTGTVTVPTNGCAVTLAVINEGLVQTVVWDAFSIADSYKFTFAGNTMSLLLGHSYEAGAVQFSVGAGGGGPTPSGFDYNGTAGCVATWAP